jgi:hypothetical protein
MGTLQFKNNASTTLSGSINNSQTAITVISGASFPVPAAGDYFYATMYEVSGHDEINIEIVKVTAVSGNNWTIVRGQDGTTARARDGIATCYIEQRMTAASAQQMLQKDNNLSDLPNPATARTNLGLGSMATQDASAVAITGGTIGGVTITGVDSTTTISDNADSTKKVAFEVSGVTTGTTRTLTIPNASGTIALLADLTVGYQPLDSDLTALAALAANGLIARTGAGTVSVRSITAPAAGLTVSNGDGVSGNPTMALANDLAAVESIATTGFVRRTGVDTWSASAIVDGDLPSALTGKTYNALTLAANATGFAVSGGTTSKTLTIINSVTLAGTDGTTITLPATTGTVAPNNQTMFIGTTSVAINRASGSLSLTGVNIDGSAGSAATAATATKATNLVGGNNTTLLGAIGYQSNTDTTTLLSPNVTTTKQFLSQTGTGANGAAPVWSAVAKSDVGLGNVENTALSTWAGSANITTLGTVASGTWNATTISIAKGGTGATTQTAGFNALAPTTTLGDLIYSDGTNNVRLAGNTTATRRFLRQTGTGSASAAPAWDTLTDPDIPSALTGKTYNGLTLVAAGTGFTVAGGATSKTLAVNNTLTFSGTDGSTLNIGAGGTLGSAAYTASTAYAPAAGSASVTTLGTITSGTWAGSTIGISYGGTGATSKIAAFDALSPAITLGDLIYSDGTDNVRLAGNTTTAKRFLTQTGTGTVSAAPGWNAIVDGDLPSALTGKTYNGLTLTANATGFQVAGGATAKTLAVSNNLTLAGTDGSTLNISNGGTLNSAAFLSSLYASSNNLGLGVTPSAWGSTYRALEVRTSAVYDDFGTSAGLTFNAFHNGSNWIYKGTGGDASALRYEQSASSHRWFTASAGTAGNAITFTQAMTLDSSGLKINGFTNLSGPVAAIKQSVDSSAFYGIAVQRAANDSTLGIAFDSSADAWQISASYAFAGAYKPIQLLTSDAVRVILDTSGNFGLGVVPSAWRSSEKAIDIAGGAAISGIANEARIYANAFVDSTPEFKYKASAAASFYNQSAGNHDWYSAPTGTAGSTATFTNVMSVTGANGNLSLHVPGARIVGEFSNATPSLRLSFQSKTTNGHTAVPAIPNGTATAAYFIAHNASTPDSSGYFYLGATASEAVLRSDRSGTADYLPIAFYTGAVQRVKIDTAGRVGMGTASPNAHLDLQNINPELRIKSTGGDRASINIDAFASYGQSIVRFASNDAEQGRIYSAANEGAPVLVFATGSSASTRMRIDNNRVQLVSSGSRGATGYVLTTANESIANAQRASGYIQWDTDVGQIGTNYFLSDIRKKDNVAPANFDSSQLIDSIEFIEFDWKKDSGNQGHVKVGVSAQQLQTLDDKLANKLSDGSLMVCDPQLISYIGKALQEQIRLVKSLQSRIVDLERARG